MAFKYFQETMSTSPKYTKWVTDNADQMVKNKNNLVACVYCRNIYETVTLGQVHNCLVCKKCGIDAVMVVDKSPLHGLSETEQQKLLLEWHVDGFTPIPKNRFYTFAH